jgi:hypothetical protein
VLCVTVGCGEVNSTGSDANVPADAAEVTPDAGVPADAKTCAPNTTTCQNGQVEVCGEAGTVVDVEACALGCAPQGTRCYQVTPSNGLAPYLDQASGMEPVNIPAGTIDTDSGEVLDPSGNRINVVTAAVQQTGNDDIRVIMAGAFSLGNVRITGRNAIALVSPGPIDISGVVDLSGDMGVDGPGAGGCAVGRGGVHPVPGHWARQRAGSPTCATRAGYVWVSYGGGGGGFGTAGGSVGDGANQASGGAAGDPAQDASLAPLRGGCPGSGVRGREGGAGGAIQLVSATAIRFDSNSSPAVIHAGGGGGGGAASLCVTDTVAEAAGGGSGGAVLLEAPVVQLRGAGSGIVTSGGAGGSGCNQPGAGADHTGAIALAPMCGAAEHGATGGAGASIAPAGNADLGGNSPYGG